MKKIIYFVFFSMLLSCVDINEDFIETNENSIENDSELDNSEFTSNNDIWSPIDTTIPFYYEGEYHQIHYDSVKNIYYFY